jgi:TnpA family transposase
MHAGPKPKYFGFERGVTYYNLVSDQFTGLNAIVIPGTLRDSLYLLSVVLEQQTELHPIEIMTDTVPIRMSCSDCFGCWATASAHGSRTLEVPAIGGLTPLPITGC